MSITINVTPPVSKEDIEAAVDFLQSMGGDCAGNCAAVEVQVKDDLSGLENVKADITEPETTATLAKSSTGTMIPWDERIHSKGKTVNADDSWRLKRGVDDAVLKAIEAELLGDGSATPEPGVQTVSQGEATPPPGAVEAMNNAGATPPPPPPATEAPPVQVRYKHGDQTFTKDELLAANWSDAQIAALETVEAPAAPVETPAPTPTAGAGAPTNFAEAALRMSSDGISQEDMNAHVVRVATAKGKPTVTQFALLAHPDHADVLAQLTAELWGA